MDAASLNLFFCWFTALLVHVLTLLFCSSLALRMSVHHSITVHLLLHLRHSGHIAHPLPPPPPFSQIFEEMHGYEMMGKPCNIDDATRN
jgi:hypothetical protein